MKQWKDKFRNFSLDLPNDILSEAITLKTKDGISFMAFFYVPDGTRKVVFQFIPKTSKDWDLISEKGQDTIIKSTEEFLKKKTGIQFKYDSSMSGAGLNFAVNFDKLEKFFFSLLA